MDTPHEKTAGSLTLGVTKGTSEDSKCSVVLSLFQDAPSAFTPPASKGLADACIFREFVPMVKDNKDKEGDEECSPTLKGKKEPHNGNINIGRFEGLSIDTQMKLAQGTSTGMKQPTKVGTSLQNDSKGNKSYLKHIPPYSIDRQSNESVQTPGSDATCLTYLSNQGGPNGNPNLEKGPSISATTDHHASTSMSSVHQSFAAFPPFTQFCSSQDAYRSFLNMSSTFSNLILSTLLQNPAVHAAASLAASFWPAADVETSTGSTSETFVGGIPVRHMNGSPSMAAIAAATVAAASAWWATHGLLPFCHPAFHSGFTFAPASADTIPKTEAAQATEDNKQKKDEVTQSQTWMDPQRTVGPELSAPGIQSSPLSSSDSDESGGDGGSQNIIPKGRMDKQVNPSPDSAVDESDMATSKKKVDRSSCGSNTPSSSEVETDTLLENIERGKEETKEVHLSHPPCGDTNNRKLRGGSNVSESWKEVSQEGRLAFQALFSREVLPQSFSPPHAKEGTVGTAKDENEVAALTVDLNSNASSATDNDPAQGINESPRASGVDLCLLTNEIGQVKLKSRRTGFKPYKRCSMEAKESRASLVEEKDKKRIRLDGESM
ncbi:hypothetical protein Taro_041129 [Colocasia esculenta]|uniref:Protein LHY n=1 Tax=Colocasia esculenta TaxID=4460 RepID=A0A843WWF2_COLES|nr:hypothetical protein [Colocasia esculenta]